MKKQLIKTKLNATYQTPSNKKYHFQPRGLVYYD